MLIYVLRDFNTNINEKNTDMTLHTYNCVIHMDGINDSPNIYGVTIYPIHN